MDGYFFADHINQGEEKNNERDEKDYRRFCGRCDIDGRLTGYGRRYGEKGILMISNGQGFNTVKATDCYTGSTGVSESFPIKGAMNTSSVGASGGYVGQPYNPTSMWSSFNYQKTGYTDSASAATALYTGMKNDDNQINMTTSGALLTTLPLFCAVFSCTTSMAVAYFVVALAVKELFNNTSSRIMTFSGSTKVSLLIDDRFNPRLISCGF